MNEHCFTGVDGALQLNADSNWNIFWFECVTTAPTGMPSADPTSKEPTMCPTQDPSSKEPTNHPSTRPTADPTSKDPTNCPTADPTYPGTRPPTRDPTTSKPTVDPSNTPTSSPTKTPSMNPTSMPSNNPTMNPTMDPSSKEPTMDPSSKDPTTSPTLVPTSNPIDPNDVGGQTGLLICEGNLDPNYPTDTEDRCTDFGCCMWDNGACKSRVGDAYCYRFPEEMLNLDRIYSNKEGRKSGRENRFYGARAVLNRMLRNHFPRGFENQDRWFLNNNWRSLVDIARGPYTLDNWRECKRKFKNIRKQYHLKVGPDQPYDAAYTYQGPKKFYQAP